MRNHNQLYILLAAGFSRRFGSPKLLHQLPSGDSIIGKSIQALKASECNFIVAIRDDDENLLHHVASLNAEILRVSQAHKGLSSVIAESVAQLSEKELVSIGICLADMPYISPQTFKVLQQHTSSTEIIRSRYKEKFGHPVIFGSEFFQSLCELNGDHGAKSVVAKASQDKLHTVEVDDPMILYDIDRPEDIL